MTSLLQRFGAAAMEGGGANQLPIQDASLRWRSAAKAGTTVCEKFILGTGMNWLSGAGVGC
ncbi:MAG TPA: hypothetical protein VGL34_24785 [Steroidobacteraceae bacterium]|jgi:hypothetical protein